MGIDVFVIDPPWPQKKGGLRRTRPNQGKKLDYATLDVDAIFSLLERDVLSKATRNHCVFLWAIDKFLAEAEAGMLKRGYRLHARLIWDKGNGVAPSFTVRYTHEYLLWFYKEKLLPVSIPQRGRFATVIRERSREHSRKPDAAYQMIESLYPGGRRLDVFSREHREGWEQYGDQKDFFKQGPKTGAERMTR